MVIEDAKSLKSNKSREPSMKSREPSIKACSMDGKMKEDAILITSEAMEKCKLEKDIAAYIKENMDKKHSPTWHCIVGRNFGAYITYEKSHFIYFYLNNFVIMLFKTAV